MGSFIKSTVIFSVGIAVGAAIAHTWTKRKYENLIDDEINSVIEEFSNNTPRVEKDPEIQEKIQKNLHKPDIFSYARDMKEKYKYNTVSDKIKEKKKKEEEEDEDDQQDGPYLITADEFGEYDEYQQISLKYYADGILADELDNIIDDVEEIVGDALDHFGDEDQEEYAVYVRNDGKQSDYVVVMDEQTFEDATDLSPHKSIT